MVAQYRTPDPPDVPILQEVVKQDRLLQWSDYYRALDTVPGEQSALLEPDSVAAAPALVWTPEAQRLYHRIKGELWPGDALVCNEWRLELYQPERLHFKTVKRTVTTARIASNQVAWWGRMAWYKDKYRDYPWTPCRRLWTKRQVMGKPYYRLVCGLREVCLEHIDPATQGWLQKRFAMYLAARGVTAAGAHIMVLPIALERDVAPVHARGRRGFERTEETVQLERVTMQGFTEKVTTTVYIGERTFELEIQVQEQGIVKGGRYLILGQDTATGMMVCRSVGLTGFLVTPWRVLAGSFVPDVYQQKGE